MGNKKQVVNYNHTKISINWGRARTKCTKYNTKPHEHKQARWAIWLFNKSEKNKENYTAHKIESLPLYDLEITNLQ